MEGRALPGEKAARLNDGANPSTWVDSIVVRINDKLLALSVLRRLRNASHCPTFLQRSAQ